MARHAGAARFAYNQCLRLHLDARAGKAGTEGDLDAGVPWSGFDLINAFNVWKLSEAAGRRIVVDSQGTARVETTGLPWRGEVSSQVFEEAAKDLGRALKAWTDSRRGRRAGSRHGHPRFKKKGTQGSFRLRNKTHRTSRGVRSAIRVGESQPRSVALPGIGVVRVHDDTRRLRRMLENGRARVLFGTVFRRGGRWRISLSVEAAELHSATQHAARAVADVSGWVGVDRGLNATVVAATAAGIETLRIAEAPRAARNAQPKTRRLAKAVSRKAKGSRNRRAASFRLERHHEKIRARRRHFLHQVSNRLVKTHDRLVIEDLNVAGMLKNHRLAAAISDAAWGELARQIIYKSSWRGGTVAVADRWWPSSKTCSACGEVKVILTLAERTFTCETCGLAIDRDTNAAINLAAWGEMNTQAPDLEARGREINAHRPERAGRGLRLGETIGVDVGTSPRPSRGRTSEKDGAGRVDTI